MEGRAEFEYDAVSEFNTLEVVKSLIGDKANLEQGVLLFSDKGCLMGKVKYDPNANFNYFATSSGTHDGTLAFVLEIAANVLRDVFTCQTYNKRIIRPELVNEKLFDKYYFDYTIGDIVMFYNRDLCDEKEKTIAALPIKFDVSKEKRYVYEN